MILCNCQTIDHSFRWDQVLQTKSLSDFFLAYCQPIFSTHNDKTWNNECHSMWHGTNKNSYMILKSIFVVVTFEILQFLFLVFAANLHSKFFVQFNAMYWKRLQWNNSQKAPVLKVVRYFSIKFILTSFKQQEGFGIRCCHRSHSLWILRLTAWPGLLKSAERRFAPRWAPMSPNDWLRYSVSKKYLKLAKKRKKRAKNAETGQNGPKIVKMAVF